MEVWLEKVAHDYDSLRVFDCPAYYHVKENKLGPRTRKRMFIGFKKAVKSYEIWDPKDKSLS